VFLWVRTFITKTREDENTTERGGLVAWFVIFRRSLARSGGAALIDCDVFSSV